MNNSFDVARHFNETAKDYIQYYGMNATDFFGRKISWETCKQACVYETFNYSYAGVYRILIPIALTVACALLYFIFKSTFAKGDEVPLIHYGQAILFCSIFLYMLSVFFVWFVIQVKYARGLS